MAAFTPAGAHTTILLRENGKQGQCLSCFTGEATDFCLLGYFVYTKLSGMPLQVAELGNLGVDIYILISGYFISKMKYDFRKMLQIILQVFFYSIALFILFLSLGLIPFSIKALIKTLFPVIFRKYWFVTVYVIMYAFSPFLNTFFNMISRRQFASFLGTMLVFWCVIPTFTAQSMYGDSAVQFIMLYSIGAYLRKYPNNIFTKKHVSALTVIISAGLMIASTLTFNLLGQKYSIFSSFGTYFYSRTSILVIALAVGLFITFANRKPMNNKLINVISSCTFGVYLIHDNPEVRMFLWKNLFNNASFANSQFMFLHMLISVLLVFSVCTLIEYVQKTVIQKPTMNFINKHWTAWTSSFTSAANKLFGKMDLPV